jgi:hypothetical protein
MREHGSPRIGFPALVLIALLAPGAASPQTVAQTPAAAPKAQPAPASRDGQHDFDFLLGAWKYHLKKLVNPLTGSTQWIEFDGKGACRPVWNGLSQLDELDVDGRNGHIQGLTLRLYNPEGHQWSLNWVNAKTGTLGVPTVGSFDARNGRGEFYDQEVINGRSIFVRYIWSGITPNSAHFEQSFSDDGGKTWETNWITDQVRVAE